MGGLRVYGLSKPLGSSSTNYVWSETYHMDYANPEDILVENWGTADVYPGTYHLEAKYTNGTLYEDLGPPTRQAPHAVGGSVTAGPRPPTCPVPSITPSSPSPPTSRPSSSTPPSPH